MLDVIKVTRRIQRVVAEKLKGGAMKVIGAGPRDCRDHSTGGPPEFGRGHKGVDLEFLHAVHTEVRSRRTARSAVGMIVDVGTIQQEAVGIGPASVDVESHSGAEVKRRASLTRAHTDDARLQEGEVVPASAVQWQVSNGSFVHQRAHGRGGRFHERRFLGDRDLVGKLSDLESEVNYC